MMSNQACCMLSQRVLTELTHSYVYMLSLYTMAVDPPVQTGARAGPALPEDLLHHYEKVSLFSNDIYLT